MNDGDEAMRRMEELAKQVFSVSKDDIAERDPDEEEVEPVGDPDRPEAEEV